MSAPENPRPEADDFIRCMFHLEVAATRTTIIQLADCSMRVSIGHLKEDLARYFGDPAGQVWSVEDRVFEDDRTFGSYCVDPSHDELRPLRIVVRISQPSE
ncbi:uncharacterized protein LOC101862493 [Aplysia californica]|uniref:Uncharacterized protein LOC101862493 n=1 Tax=Aplysia californica TaxID=6500 RepID=A0ABM0JKR4_APLCA|nr:uncharacterized protein LOC101862493 [Aplysia californica]